MFNDKYKIYYDKNLLLLLSDYDFDSQIVIYKL